MDGHGDADAVDVGRHTGQVDFDALIVALAFAGLVIARVDDGTVGRLQVVVEDEVRVATDFAVAFQEEGAAVKVEGGAVGRTRIPAEADDDLLQVRCFLAQVDVAAFLQTDCHVVLLK